MMSYDSYNMTTQRITITIQDDLHKKLRYVQADLLRKTNDTVSLSGVIDFDGNRDELRDFFSMFDIITTANSGIG